MKHKPSGLTVWFGWLFLQAVSFSILLFSCIYFGGGTMLEYYVNESDSQIRYAEKRMESLQQYVIEHNLSTRDATQITAWAKKYPLILLEIYRDNILLYTSSAPDELLEVENEAEAPYYDWVSYYQVNFSDGEAQVVIYANDIYSWLSLLLVAALLLSFVLFLLIFLRGCRKLVNYICQLSTEIQAMEGGDLEVPITIQDDHELTQLARSLDSMQAAFKEQREQEAAIFRANQQMITEMSHDLRTPLTTLEIYTDILRLKKYDPSQLDDYLEKIYAKASQIKQLSENIFEYSLISRQQDIRLEVPVPVEQVFHDILSEFVAYLGQRDFQFDLSLDWPTQSIAVYSPYIKRLVDNITSNLIKYADTTMPVVIDVFKTENGVTLSFRNAIRQGATEQEGTHIGLSNMRTMMKKMGGEARFSKTETSFCTMLIFPGISQ